MYPDFIGRLAIVISAVCLLAVGPGFISIDLANGRPGGGTEPPARDPTIEEAVAFVDSAQSTIYELEVSAARAAWLFATFITHDSEILSAEAQERWLQGTSAFASAAARFDHLDLPYDLRRQLDILKRNITMPVPPDPQKAREVSRLNVEMESRYGSGEYCSADGECLDLETMTEILRTSRDPDSLLMVWTGWRTVSPPMRGDYQRFVELMNEGARSLGFTDTGDMWRSHYDMPTDEFAAEVDRLWDQVRPLYDALHCYVRGRLVAYYGADVVDPEKPIPAHLLGNMWAQDWSNIFDIVAPADADPRYDVTEELQQRDVDAVEMVRYGERFFTSIGMDPLPESFWDRSLFTKPRDRHVVCHASAWNLDHDEDLRIKMCITPTQEDFQTIHHELGHNFYQRAYNEQPFLYRNSANDGFHEALGDAVALSVTPTYLRDIGLLDEVPPLDRDIGILLKNALEKVSFLPFGLLIDKWRWQVFSGEVPPEAYNEAWWQLREQYQGVAAPVARSEEDFDPGAKYHVPANVPYTRYFLAHILQFQMHRSLCEAAGFEGPLHRCSIYGSREAGDRLSAMMEMGLSRPWPDALEALTGSREMDASAILAYFAPLLEWLEERNAGQSCGW